MVPNLVPGGVLYRGGVGSARLDFENGLVICADQSGAGRARDSDIAAGGRGRVEPRLAAFRIRRRGGGSSRVEQGRGA